METVLIGCCGGLTGIYLAKQMRTFSNLKLIGSEVATVTPGRFFVDDLIYLPPSSSDEFLDALIKALNSAAVDYYIPTHSKEIICVAKNAEYIRKSCKADFLVSPFGTYEALDNKEKAIINLSLNNIPTPKMILQDDDKAHYPIFYKRKVGSGGAGSGIIRDKETKDAICKASENLLMCEFIEGEEYTVDCIFSRQGKLLGYNQRKRLKCIGGAVSITSNDNSIDIEPYLAKLSSIWKFIGCVNFQYIVRDSIPYFIDINLRYASGGLPLSVASGVDVPKAMMKMFRNEYIADEEFKSDKKKRTMYRYFEEIFEDENTI